MTENLWQVICQILGAYFEDDCADELIPDPVLTAILDKKALASQPTLSRFFNRMDETTLNQFYVLMRRFRKIELRNGTDYSSTGVVEFLQPLLDEFQTDYPQLPLLLRGDSGFAKPELYEQCETNGVSYVIRLKLLKIAVKAVHSARYFSIFYRHCFRSIKLTS